LYLSRKSHKQCTRSEKDTPDRSADQGSETVEYEAHREGGHVGAYRGGNEDDIQAKFLRDAWFVCVGGGGTEIAIGVGADKDGLEGCVAEDDAGGEEAVERCC